MELKKIFNHWGKQSDSFYKNSELLLNGWEDFEGVTWPKRKIDILLDSIFKKIQVNQKDIIVDIGCGSGWINYALNPYCKLVFALDISLEMLRRAKRVNPGLKSINGEGAYLPFKNKCFDKLICYFVIMNIIDDEYVLNMFKAAVQSLKKGGIALFGQMPDIKKSKEHDDAKSKYRKFLLKKYKEPKFRIDHRFPIKLFDRDQINQQLSSISGIEHSILDSFNPYWMKGEPEEITWRFDLVITKIGN